MSKIQTLHPDPNKQGVNIDRHKFDLVRGGIFKMLEHTPPMKPMKLFAAVAMELDGQMEGSIMWYAVSVKLDMEARGELTHDRKKGIVSLTGEAPNPPL